jgi:hypothetical protein
MALEDRIVALAVRLEDKGDSVQANYLVQWAYDNGLVPFDAIEWWFNL